MHPGSPHTTPEPRDAIGALDPHDPHRLMLQRLDRFSDEDRARIAKALAFSITAHAGQTRKDGKTPYVVHPVAVAQALIDKMGADAETVMTGLLHDVVEDTGVSLDTVEEAFGPAVRHLVDGVTDFGEGDGNPRVPDKLARWEKTKEKALRYAEKDSRLLLVKVADRWHNMQTVHVHTPRGQVGYARATKVFHIVQARRIGQDAMADELERMCDATIARWPEWQ
jgi:(p)ppGpp synthase/HD superfamily hydrolase